MSTPDIPEFCDAADCSATTIAGGLSIGVYVCTLPPGHSGLHWDGIEGWEW